MKFYVLLHFAFVSQKGITASVVLCAFRVAGFPTDQVMSAGKTNAGRLVCLLLVVNHLLIDSQQGRFLISII